RNARRGGRRRRRGGAQSTEVRDIRQDHREGQQQRAEHERVVEKNEVRHRRARSRSLAYLQDRLTPAYFRPAPRHAAFRLDPFAACLRKTAPFRRAARAEKRPSTRSARARIRSDHAPAFWENDSSFRAAVSLE